jgi:hypothetical protein
MKTKFEQYIDRQRSQYGDKFDASELAPQFVEALNNGDRYRVKVQSPYGGKPYWGFIGITTGWKPAFLLMFRRGQIGSSFLLSDKYQIVGSKTLPA